MGQDRLPPQAPQVKTMMDMKVPEAVFGGEIIEVSAREALKAVSCFVETLLESVGLRESRMLLRPITTVGSLSQAEG